MEGGTAHGWERSTDQLVCLEVPPAPVYKGVEEGGRPSLWRALGEPFQVVGVGEKEREKRREGRRGHRPSP